MITSPTVLVLGAGSSLPYGFPSGPGLARGVVESLRYGHLGYAHLLAAGFAAEQIEKFRYSLERSGRSSVDAFLEHRTEFLDVGKAAIAALLLPCENETSLFDLSRQKRWYEYLFQKLNSGFDNFADNQISFITFNYDRSLDFYLFTALKHAYGRPADEIAAVLGNLPLIHVYGQLGRLPEFGGTIPYGATPENPAVIKAAANGIRIIHEDTHGDDSLERARTLIGAAKRVCFIGFGYHTTNLQRLGLPGSCSRAEIYGSAVGLTIQECKKIAALFENRIDLDWAMVCKDCLDFLRMHTPLD